MTEMLETMQPENDKTTKDIANELASLLFNGSADDHKIAGLFDILQPDDKAETIKYAGLASRAPQPVKELGIWIPAVRNGSPCFERDPSRKPEWPMWADIHRIGPKGDKKRVVLLGESVARGYFYDPYYTVAKELAGIFVKVDGIAPVEVIDLARTSMQMEGLRQLAGSTVALQPDAVLIFAGNNWSAQWKHLLDDTRLTEPGRSGGTPVYEEWKELLEADLRQSISDFLSAVGSSLVKAGIPVTFVIPGYNLKDWRSNETERAPALVDVNRAIDWYKSREEAELALAHDNVEQWGLAASAMVKADPSNPYGFELLAAYHERMGEHDKAISLLEKARDSALFPRYDKSKPRCFSVVEETLEDLAPLHGIAVVNLAKEFKQHSESIPGRELFLDYCHLTVDGIKLAMRHTATTLLRQLFQLDLPVAHIPDSQIRPSDDVVAVAHFCSAVHNAHYGQPPEILLFHCKKALQASHSIRKMMLQYIDFATRNADSVLCKSFGDIILGGNLLQYDGGTGLAHPHNGKLMDIDLVDAMVSLIGVEDADLARKVNLLRQQEHGVGDAGIDLLASFYSQMYYGNFAVEPRPSYYQARTTVSSFAFVARDVQALRLELVCRIPQSPNTAATVKVCINELTDVVAVIEVGSSWGKYSVTIDKLPKVGVNRFLIHWPMIAETSGIPTASLRQAIFPVTGEIDYFTARKA
jgi:hypothetical protein